VTEVAIFEAGRLKAPQGEDDDLAMAFISGLAGLNWKCNEEERGEGVSVIIEYPDILDGLRNGW